MQTYKVDQYIFTDSAEAKAASSEVKARDYLKAQLEGKSPKALTAAYNQILDQDIFKTVVGHAFLQELRSRVYEGGGDVTALPPIPDSIRGKDDSAEVKAAREAEAERAAAEKKAPKKEKKKASGKEPTGRKARKRAKMAARRAETAEKNRLKAEKRKAALEGEDFSLVIKYRNRSWILLVLCIVLFLMVAAMFAITLTSGSPTILNYKNKIENEYSAWDQELKQREKQLDQRERELEKRDLMNTLEQGTQEQEVQSEEALEEEVPTEEAAPEETAPEEGEIVTEEEESDE